MFSLKQPVEPKKLANISGYDTSTNEETAVTYFAGVAKIPLTWVTPLYNLRSVNVSSGDNKKVPSGASQQKKWYADIAGIACVCPDDAPVDAVLYVLVNDEVAFSGPLSRTEGTHHASFTLDTYCQQAWVRWGTKDHPLEESLILSPRGVLPPGVDPRNSTTYPRFDADGNPIGTAPAPGVVNPQSGHYDYHPAYRNQCMFEFRQFFLGSSPNMPNVVVVIARGCKFFGGDRFEASDAGVNPMGAVYEMLTDDMFGMGLSVTALDETSYRATATALDDSGIAIAPVIRQPTLGRSFIADLVQYYDGWFRFHGNVLEAGLYTHGALDDSGLLELDSDDLAGEPSVQPGTLDDTKNEFFIRYTNREKWWNEDTESYKDLANFQKVGERRPDRQSRPFILDGTLAQRYATEWGRMHAAEGGASGSANFKRESVAGLLPGDRFKLNSTSFGLAMIMRCAAIERPADNENISKLQLSVELADWEHLYIQPPAPKDPDFTIEAVAIEQARIVELPSGLKNSNALEVGVLALRPSAPIIGFHTWVSKENVTYDVVNQQTHFSVWAKVKVEDYPSTTDLTDTTVGMVVELYGPDLESIVAQSDAQRDDHNLLCFVGNEIMSVGGITPLGDGQFRIFFKRALYGTSKAAHVIDSDVWFTFRQHLDPIANANFLPGATVYFKLQPYTATETFDLADVDPIAHTFADGPFLLNNLELYGQGADLVFLGRDPRFRWQLFDISGLGIIGVPGVAPAVQHEDTGLWYELSAQLIGGTVVLRLSDVGLPDAPVTGAAAIKNDTTGLWHALTAATVGSDVVLQIADTGSGSAPAGGTPIVFCADNNLYYRLSAVTVGADNNILQFDENNGLSVGTLAGGAWADQFARFDLRVRDAVSGDTVWTGMTLKSDDHFWYEDNALSAGGPRRRFLFGVRAVYRRPDQSIGYTDWLEIEVNNPNENPRPAGHVGGGINSVDFYLGAPTALDTVGLILWRSLDPDFEINPAVDWAPGVSDSDPGFATSPVECVFKGPDLFFSVPQAEGTTYYYRAAGYDTFWNGAIADLIIEAPFAEFTLRVTPLGPPPPIDQGSQTFSKGFDVMVSPPAGMTVRYAFNATANTASQQWPGGIGSYTPIHIQQSCVLHWIGVDANGSPTLEGIAFFTLVSSGSEGDPTCPSPSVNVLSGTPGSTAVTVEVVCALGGADVQVSLNGASFASYTTPITIDLDVDSIQFYSTKSGYTDSPTDYYDNPSSGGV